MQKVTLIKRSSPPCGACNVMAAVLDNEGVLYEALDITEDPAIIDEFNLTSVPVILVGDKRFTGVTDIDEIREALR